jgi:hypothetical protein
MFWQPSNAVDAPQCNARPAQDSPVHKPQVIGLRGKRIDDRGVNPRARAKLVRKIHP